MRIPPFRQPARVLALASFAVFGAYCFRVKGHVWPGSPGQTVSWASALRWVLGSFAVGVFFGAQMGAFLGAMDRFGRRRRFTVFNSGFWMTFVLTALFMFLVVPRII
jgi:ABC-type Na+ efflux pump permease subunit